jgi:hypothetical protein
MLVSGKDKIWFIAYSPEHQDACIRQVVKDEALQEEMTRAATKFWEDLQQGISPPSKEDELLVLMPDEGKIFSEEYKEWSEIKRTAEAKLKALKEAVLEFGDDGDFQLWDLVCKRTQGRVSYDYKKMADDGIDLSKYEKKGIGFYTIKVKE